MPFRIAGLIAVCLIVASCDKEPAFPYPVYDANFAALDAKIYWLDNNRILFTGFEGGKKPSSTKNKSQIRWGLYIWDVDAGNVTKYADAKALACFSDGYIEYTLKSESTKRDGEDYIIARRMEGPLGQEALVETVFPKDPKKREKKDRSKEIFNRFTCHHQERPESMKERIMIPLKVEHGYLDFGDGAGTKEDFELKGTLVKPNGEHIETELPLKAISRFFKFYPFRQAYFGMHTPGPAILNWDLTNCHPAWWFWPDGSSERKCIPYGPWSAGSGELIVHATQNGILIKYANPSNSKAGRDSGGYLLKDDEAEKVMDGLMFHEAISPDGCRVGFVHMKDVEAGRIGGKGIRTIRAIDVCSR